MSDVFFPPPPRPRGLGWWRRGRRLAAFWSIGAAAGSLFAGIALHRWSERQESLRLVEEGRRTTCTVTDLSKTGGKSTTYHVRLRTDEPPERSFTVSVDSSDWARVWRGSKVPYYYDPDFPSRGVAEIERGKREGLFSVYFCTALVAILLIVVGWNTRKLLRDMRLFLTGVELIGERTGGMLRLRLGDLTVRIELPRSTEKYVRIPGRGERFLVLASGDLKRRVFPELRDVPIRTLAVDEGIVRRLPPPVRSPSAAWNGWLKERYRLARGWAWALGVFLVLVFGIAACAGFPMALLVVAGGLGVIDSILILAWMRLYWRDRVLWREGEEIHAVLVETREQKEWLFYDFVYSFRDREYKKRQRWKADVGAWLVESPRGAPAVTPRIVVLVDPYRPERCTLVPARLGDAT